MSIERDHPTLGKVRFQIDTRVRIMRPLDAYSNPPDHVRGAQYANLLLGTDYGAGDVVRPIFLYVVESSFFDRIEREQGLDPDQHPLYRAFKRKPDVISVDELGLLPSEFHPFPIQPPEVDLR